jgi:hypothetical protein
MNNRTSSDALDLPDGCTAIVWMTDTQSYRVTDCHVWGRFQGDLFYAGNLQSPTQGPRHIQFTADQVMSVLGDD